MSVGVAAMDEQHKEMLWILDDVQHVGDGPDGFDQVMDVLWKLHAYIEKHFVDEEAMLAQTGFPFLDLHRESHKIIAMRTMDLAETVNPGNFRQVAREIHGFLQGWLVHHIEIEDGEYRSFLSGHGPAPSRSLF